MSMDLIKADQSPEQQQITIPDVLPVLPLPDVVVFPYMIVPLFVKPVAKVRVDGPVDPSTRSIVPLPEV